MQKHNWKRLLGIILALAVVLLNYSPQVQSIRQVPAELKISEGQSHTIDLKFPMRVQVKGDNIDVLKLNGNSLKSQSFYNHRKPIEIQSVSKGDVRLSFSLLGFIPVKEMVVKIFPQRTLIPGGHSIGVTLYTKGALVVGTSEVTDNMGRINHPSEEAGLLPGDVIEKVNDLEIKNAEHLSSLVNNFSKGPLNLEIIRKGKLIHIQIKPVKDFQDQKYRLGVWVRDSTAGVGTLSYYDPKSNYFGALGHAITDIDTGSLLSVKNGEIMKSDIIDIKLGKRGRPGELRGVFLESQKAIGSIEKNTQFGIYGTCYKELNNNKYLKPIPVGFQSVVHEGPATILTTLDDEGIKEYKVEIIKINRQSAPGPKSMVIKVTDPELLKRTGGIVQGMSGSPILQDGKIVGAVTHVFVNDPTRGYGLFIEWMLNQHAS